MDAEKVIEAMLFAAEGPLRPAQILEWFALEDFQVFELNAEKLEAIMEQLEEKFKSDVYIYEIRRIEGGFQLFTKRSYYPYVRQVAQDKYKRKLSRSALETLAVIAYRQPVTKAEIEFIRGVNCDYAVRRLLEKQLLEIAGRSDAAGRPLLYKTSSYFMEYFGLNSLQDLPKLEEFTVDDVEFQAQFKQYQQEQEQENGKDGTRESSGQGS